MKQIYLIVLVFMLIGIIKIYAQAPKIESFSPVYGAVGTLVTIYGSGFSSIADSNAVNFGATRARVVSASTTRLSVRVPAGATFKPITVSNKMTRLIARSTLPFCTSFFAANTNIDKPIRFAKDTGASDVKIGDIDGDGKPDIIATNPILKLLMVYRNLSNGRINSKSFAPPVIYHTGPQSGFIGVEDMDGDGKLDVALINGSYNNGADGYNSLTFFHNLSTPGHIRLTVFPAVDTLKKVDTPKITLENHSFKLGPGDNYAKLGDFDNDGKIDLAVLNTGGFITIYRNVYVPGQSTIWAPPVTFPVGLHPTSISAGDIDGDGKLDLITANSDNSSLTILHNTSTPGIISTSSFNRADFPLSNRPLTASLADMDGDGKLDILIAMADNKPSLLIHNTSTPGHFNGDILVLNNINMINNFNNDLIIEDVNGDGKPDLLTINTKRDSVFLYTSKATLGHLDADYLNSKEDISIRALPDCIGDLNGDGIPEMVIGTRFGIDVYAGKSTSARPQPNVSQLNQDDMIIFPNPTSAFTNIKYTLPGQSNVQIRLFNQGGKVLKTYEVDGQAAGSHEKSIETSDLRMGVYVITVTANNYSKVGKLMIQ